MEDVLDMLGLEDKPFQVHKPAPQNNGYKDYNKDRPKKISLWDKTDFKAYKFDTAAFKPTKTFAIFTHNAKEALPEDVQDNVIKIARVLFAKGFTFRYNGDKGDTLQIKIVDLPESKVDCYLPWKKFNEEFTNPKMVSPTETAYNAAFSNHTKFLDLSPAVRAILSRDVHVITGEACDEPLNLVLMYNKDGSEVIDKKSDFKMQGNTVFPMRICNELNIPLFNIKASVSFQRLVEYIKNI